MNFKELVLLENQQLHAEISIKETQQTFMTSMKYIFWQEFLEDIKQLLAADESIIGYLPLTTEGNMTFTNQGMGGLAYARTEKAQEYISLFQDTRGNRLLVFTEKRLLFFVLIDYLDEGSYFSYPYETISAFTWKQRKPMRHESAEATDILFYGFFDFQSDAGIFSEVLTKKDYQLFLDFHTQIPSLSKIPINEKVYRKNVLDRFMSNWQLNYRIMYIINLVLIAIFLFLLLGVFLKIGPFNGLYYKHFQLGMSVLSPFFLWLFS